MEPKIPEFEGQVCRVLNPYADENPDDVYIIAEDPSPFDGEDTIYVVNLKDLQRNIHNPIICQKSPIAKKDLEVIADSLEDYVKLWNEVS